jgi:hypothetical protein
MPLTPELQRVTSVTVSLGLALRFGRHRIQVLATDARADVVELVPEDQILIKK